MAPPRRPNRPQQPFQSKISVQNIPDLSTPAGAAGVNEEFRRIQLALNELPTEEKAAPAQTPLQQPQSPAPPVTPTKGLSVQHNTVLVVSPATVLNFQDDDIQWTVAQTSEGTAMISARGFGGVAVGHGSVYPKLDEALGVSKHLNFFDSNHLCRSVYAQDMVTVPNTSAIPIEWDIRSGAAVRAYGRYNNLSIQTDAREYESDIEPTDPIPYTDVTEFSTNVIRFKDNNHVNFHVEQIRRAPVGRKYCERDGVVIEAETRCDTTRWDTPKWANGTADINFSPGQQCNNLYAGVAFTNEVIARPNGRPYPYSTTPLSTWSYRAHYKSGTHRLHCYLHLRLLETADQSVQIFMLLLKNGVPYSVLDWSTENYKLQVALQAAGVSTLPALATHFNLEGEDDIHLDKGDEITVAVSLQSLIPGAPPIRTLTLYYGYVAVEYLDDCAEKFGTPASIVFDQIAVC